MQSRNESRGQPLSSNSGLGLYNAGLPASSMPYNVGNHQSFSQYGKDDLSAAFQGLNLAGLNPSSLNKGALPTMGAGIMPLPVNNGPASAPYCYAVGDRLYVAGNPNPNASYPPNVGNFNFLPPSHYMQPSSFQAAQAPTPRGPQPAGPSTSTNSGGVDLPELTAPRRNSLSSNEENGPRTPFFGGHSNVDMQPKITPADHSPQTWTTPSPQQLGHAFYPQHAVKPQGYALYDLDSICMQEPAIPRPIPAIFSGEKGRGTLESSLVNKLNTTNVYVRGLHPDTTDDMLYQYGLRFGAIESAKSMMDQQTGTCKGFGFIKYYNFADGQNCIRGFYHWGYEAKWARVSHNEKLKSLGDRQNTNLYVSGIPTDVDFNEHSLMAIFSDFKCLSSKILRDANGLSRGVGFARFEAPEECVKIIEQYNGQLIGREGQPISIRFADTADQKKLKQETQQRRQFKTHEYNMAAYGPNSPYQQLSPIVAAFSSPLNPRGSTFGVPWQPQNHYSSIYGTPAGVTPAWQNTTPPQQTTVTKAQGAAENVAPNSALRSGERVKFDQSVTGSDKTDSPSTAVLAKRTLAGNVSSPVKSVSAASATAGSLAFIDSTISPVKSIKSVKSSPGKVSPAKGSLLRA